MAGWRDRAAQLWTPHPSLQDESVRQRARVGAGLLLALLPMCLLAMLLPQPPGQAWPPSGLWLQAGLALALLACYGLVRNGRVDAGLGLAILAVGAAVAVSRWVAGTQGHGEQPILMFLVFPVLLAGLLLPPRPAAAVAAATLAGAWALEGALDRRLGSGIDPEDVAYAVLLAGVAVIAVLASAMAARQARQLDESRMLLRQVTDNIPEVFFVVAADFSRMRYVSPAYGTVMGRRVEQAMADPLDWLNAVHPDDLAQVKARLAAGETLFEYRAVLPSGTVKQVRARTFPVAGADGRPASLVGIAEDVTEARRAQEQLREAQRQRIHLLQQLAHDLASPLTPVKIQLHLLKGRVDAEGQQGVAIVRRNVEHLERLVADVRDVARLEGGGLRIDRREIDLVALARQAVETLAPTAAERQVKVSLESPVALSVRADPGRLTQVLYNLVGNALKFTPPGGTVTVAVAREDGEARIDVRDTGAGLRPDQLARLFRPFSQVHDPGTVQRPEDKGTGLGLFITKGIVEAHGGRVAVRSAGPGLGSTFTVSLPLAEPT